MVDKSWLYQQGGRPVIYQSDEEYYQLPDSHKYRHKVYDPLKGIDFTWEREWRIHTNELILDPSETTVIVPNRGWVENFKQEHIDSIESDIMIFKKDAWMMIDKYPWHFIALEDLGVHVNWG